jgi:hypothetical protein
MGTIQSKEDLDASLQRRRQNMSILRVDDLLHFSDLLGGRGGNELRVEISNFSIESEQRIPSELSADVPFGLKEDKAAAYSLSLAVPTHFQDQGRGPGGRADGGDEETGI